MVQSGTPQEYWVKAFSTVVYLINRLPSKILNYMSSYEKLFHRKPDYSVLRSFGCTCFPYLMPMTKINLNFNLKGVFLGYSLHHQGCRCLGMSTTGRLYLLCHVIFNKSEFPFTMRQILTSPTKETDPVLLSPLMRPSILDNTMSLC